MLNVSVKCWRNNLYVFGLKLRLELWRNYVCLGFWHGWSMELKACMVFIRSFRSVPVIIIIIYSGYPLHRSAFQWGPAEIMYNTMRYNTIQYNAIRYDTRYDTISFFQCSFLQLVFLESSQCPNLSNEIGNIPDRAIILEGCGRSYGSICTLKYFAILTIMQVRRNIFHAEIKLFLYDVSKEETVFNDYNTHRAT